MSSFVKSMSVTFCFITESSVVINSLRLSEQPDLLPEGDSFLDGALEQPKGDFLDMTPAICESRSQCYSLSNFDHVNLPPPNTGEDISASFRAAPSSDFIPWGGEVTFGFVVPCIGTSGPLSFVDGGRKFTRS